MQNLKLPTIMHRRILGYNRWDSASNMFVSNAIDNFDASLRKNIELGNEFIK